MTTAEELKKMTTEEKNARYSFDVIKTEEIKRDDAGIFYRYNFLFGPGSLGYPYGKHTAIGDAVEKIATELHLLVWWNMENSYADFSGKITQEVIAKHFLPIWEESDRRKNLTGTH